MLGVVCCLFALISCTFSAVTDETVFHPVIDLEPFVYGFVHRDNVGAQRYWIEEKTIMIDLSKFPTFPLRHDGLWEATVSADISGSVASQSCSFAIGYVSNGLMHKVRSGSIGGDPSHALSEPQTSFSTSSILWLRGIEVKQPSHVFISIDSCYLSRYVTNMQFERWNGQAYLMDWSSRAWLHEDSENIGDDLFRLADAESITTDPTRIELRDSTIFHDHVGWWMGEFIFDASPFENITQPVLELWGYISTGSVIDVDADTFVNAASVGVAFTKTFTETRILTRGNGDFVSVNVPFVSSRGPFTLLISSAMAPYARLWDALSTTRRGAPFLITFPAQTSSSDPSVCENTDLTDNQFTTDFIVTLAFQCVHARPVEMRFALPAEVETLNAPFFTFFEYTYSQRHGFDVKMNGVKLYTSEQDEGSLRQGEAAAGSGEIQIGLGLHATRSSIVSFVLTSETMAGAAAVPLYSGSTDHCVSNNMAEPVCKNGGECFNFYDKAHCVCKIGFTGADCSESTVVCEADSCLNSGKCVETLEFSDQYKCECTPEYTGVRCERVADNCPQEECLNGGKCVGNLPLGEWKCDCVDHYEGKFCEVNTDECDLDLHACKNGGTCVDGNHTYTCNCADGWSGPWCETKTACYGSNNPCMHDGLCFVNDEGETKCVCTTMDNIAYFGEHCEHTYKEVAEDCRFSSPCENAGVCTNLAGGDLTEWRCVCDKFWEGDHCEKGTLCNDNYCENGAWCHQVTVNGVNHPKCVCPAGFFGERCESLFAAFVDDCRFYNKDCMHGGTCQLIVDQNVHQCTCPRQYTGPRCETADVCHGTNNPCVVGMCRMGADGNAECSCPTGYAGAHCEMTLEEYLSHSWMEHIKDCRHNPMMTCMHGGVCGLAAGSVSTYECHCTSAWTGDRCELHHACEPNPCRNGGECFWGNGMVQCHCPGDFVGDHCEEPLASFATLNCRLTPCQHGGVCGAENICHCNENWVGQFCELPAACEPNVCENGGVCHEAADDVTVPLCYCPSGFYGDRCQYNRGLSASADSTDCQVHPCQHGGECGTFLGKNICRCPKEYTGVFCEVHHGCDPNPCQNGGACFDEAGHWGCACAGDFYGATCGSNLVTDISAARTTLYARIQSLVSAAVVSTKSDLNSQSVHIDATWAKVKADLQLAASKLAALGPNLESTAHADKELADQLTKFYTEYAKKEQLNELKALFDILLEQPEPVN